MNISTLAGNEIHGIKSKVGFHVGVLYLVPVKGSMFVQAEAMFSTEGRKQSGTVIEGDDGGFINLTFLNIATLFRYNFEGGFHLASGPQYGVLISAKSKFYREYDIKEDMEDGQFSWAFAAGYDLPQGIGFYGRYNVGISNLLNVDYSRLIMQSNVLQVGAR